MPPRISAGGRRASSGRVSTPSPPVGRSSPGAGETAGEVKKQPSAKWARPSFRSSPKANPQEAQSNGHALDVSALQAHSPTEGVTHPNSPSKPQMMTRRGSVSKAVVVQEMHKVSIPAHDASDLAHDAIQLEEGSQKLEHRQTRQNSAVIREASLAQVSARRGSGWKSEMTAQEGAILLQRHCRGQQARKKVLHVTKRLHIQYEIKIIEQRQERRKLVSQFLMHVIYMTIMVSVFVLQHGHSVGSRYSMVAVLKQYVAATITPTGVTFDTIRTIPDVWEWTEALIAKTAVVTVATPEDEEEDADADNQTETTGETQRRQLKAAAARGGAATAAAAGGGRRRAVACC